MAYGVADFAHRMISVSLRNGSGGISWRETPSGVKLIMNDEKHAHWIAK
jgi:hypothetical protein